MKWLEFTELEEQTGRIWHRMVGNTASYRYYPEAAVSLEEVRVALGVFFRGLGGSPGIGIIAGTPQSSQHRLTLRQRLGLMQESLARIECNAERMLVPDTLGYFPDSSLNRRHYFWLAAYFATANDSGRPLHPEYTDPLQADLAFLHRAYWTSVNVCERYPGLVLSYRSLGAALWNRRPQRALTSQEQAVEAVIQALLCNQTCADDLGSVFLHTIRHCTPEFSHWQASRHYRTFLPVPLWGVMHDFLKSANVRPETLDDSIGTSAEADEKQNKRKAGGKSRIRACAMIRCY